MEITARFFSCVAIVLYHLVLFQLAQATPPLSDRDRAILIYNGENDPCTKLHAYSHREEKDAADWACKEGFLALDRIGGNSCRGYRKPGCRFFVNSLQRECSCLISLCSHLLIVNDVEKPFRECAVDFWTEELYAGNLKPSFKYQETSNRVENSALQSARTSRNPSFNAGALYGAVPSYGAGSSYGAVPSYGAGSSYGAGPSSGAGPSYSAGSSWVTTTPYGGPTPAGSMNRGTSYVDNTSYGGLTQVGSSSFQDKGASSAMSTMNSPTVEAYYLERPYVCVTCQRRYLTPLSLAQHRKSHETNETYCEPCKRNYSTTSSFNLHWRRRHAKEAAAEQGAPSESGSTRSNVGDTEDASDARGKGGKIKIFKCDICGNEYKSARYLREHRETHTADVRCRVCNKNYSAGKNLEQHAKSAHPGFEAVALGLVPAPLLNEELTGAYNESKPHVCPKCGQRYKARESLRQHLKKHDTDATTCPICNKVLSTEFGLKSHMNSQHGPKKTSGSGSGESSGKKN